MYRTIFHLIVLGAALLVSSCNQPAMQRNTSGAVPKVAESLPPVQQTPPAAPKILEMPPPTDMSSPQAVDINTASMDQLRKMPFIGDSYAMKIIQGRPYKRKDELSSRNILPPHVYQKAKDYLIASGSR